MSNDLKIIAQLCKTYNTSLLDNLSDDTILNLKKTLKGLSQKQKDSAFKGLIYIIQNHLNPTYIPIPTYVRGPYSLSAHRSKKYNKYIYVFGEYHMIKNECLNRPNSISIESFLSTHIKNSDKFIDLFLETPFINKISPEYLNAGLTHMKDIQDKFGTGCTGFEKGECKYPNLRYHYGDIRKSYSKNMLIRAFNDIGQYRAMHESALLYYSPAIISQIDSLLKIPELDSQSGIISLLEREFNNLKIEKQLEKMDKDVKRGLIMYINYKLNKHRREYNLDTVNVKDTLRKFREILSHISSLGQTSSLGRTSSLKSGNAYKLKAMTKKMPEIKKLSAQLFTIFSGGYSYILMDMYVLSRIFRSYTPIKNRNSSEPQYIIMYAGDSHSENYREYFNQIGFEQLYKITTSSGDDNCLEIGGKIGDRLFPEYM